MGQLPGGPPLGGQPQQPVPPGCPHLVPCSSPSATWVLLELTWPNPSPRLPRPPEPPSCLEPPPVRAGERALSWLSAPPGAEGGIARVSPTCTNPFSVAFLNPKNAFAQAGSSCPGLPRSNTAPLGLAGRGRLENPPPAPAAGACLHVLCPHWPRGRVPPAPHRARSPALLPPAGRDTVFLADKKTTRHRNVQELLLLILRERIKKKKVRFSHIHIHHILKLRRCCYRPGGACSGRARGT